MEGPNTSILIVSMHRLKQVIFIEYLILINIISFFDVCSMQKPFINLNLSSLVDDTKSSVSNLATSLLEWILVELIPTLQGHKHECTDWISKDITVQIIKVFLKDKMTNICQDLLQSVDSDAEWKLYLTSLRHYLWPDVLSEMKIVGKDVPFSATEENETFAPIKGQTAIRGIHKISENYIYFTNNF